MICSIVPVNLFATEYDVLCGNEHAAKFKKPALSLKDTCSIAMNDKEYSSIAKGLFRGIGYWKKTIPGRLPLQQSLVF